MVGHANDLHVLDARVGVEELFDLAREDVLAAADDDVLVAAHDPAVARRIQRCPRARVRPEAGARGHGREAEGALARSPVCIQWPASMASAVLASSRQ